MYEKESRLPKVQREQRKLIFGARFQIALVANYQRSIYSSLLACHSWTPGAASLKGSRTMDLE